MGTPSGKIPHLRIPAPLAYKLTTEPFMGGGADGEHLGENLHLGIPVPLAYELTTEPFMGGGADGEHLGENLHLGIPAPLAYKLTTAPMGREADVGYLGDPQIAHL